ncbi:hypothetical protein Tco_0922079 [Tanacetum coccineum]|uniref:Uncharacterized protein n=1 Tax=Tanacetum coccineum TaxID=301880 RepID=A0ABQ5CYC1_9ASTR
MTCGTELTDGVCLQCCPYPNYYDNTPNYSDYPPQPEYQTYSCESCGNDAHYGYPCPSFVPDPCYNRNFDCFPHDSQTLPQQYQTPPSIKLLLAEEEIFEYQAVVEEEQTQPEYLQELLQSLLKDLQILNEIQPLKQETPNQIQKDQEEKSIAELLAEERLQKANQALNENQSPQQMRIQDLEIQKQQCLEEMKEWMDDLGIREIRKEEINIDYRRKYEDKIYELKDTFNGLSIEIWKIIQEAEELRESEARARIQKIIIDDDDDDLGFYAVHPNTIHTPVSQNVEPKDSLIMGDGHINTTPETETISVETLVSNPSESDDFSLGECNLFDIDDSYYEKSTSRLTHLAPISPEIVEVCVDDDDTDDDDDYDDDVYVDDCVDIEEDGGEIDLDISKIVDISLREKLVESYLLIEKINAFSLSPPIPISPIFCPSSTIPVVDLDLESLPKDDFDNDDDLFEMDSNNDEWKRILYGEDFERMDSDSDKTKDFDKSSSSVFKSLSDEFEPGGSSYVEGNDLVCYEDFHVSDVLFSTINEDKVFNPGILVDKNSKVHEQNVLPTLSTRSSEMMLDFDLENFQVEPKNDILNPKVLVFDPGIFDNVLTRKSSLTLKIFDPPSIVPPFIRTNSLVWGGFPDFGGFMVQYCGRTKQCPQFPLMVSNLLFIKWEISYPKGKRKPNLGGVKAGRKTRERTRNQVLKDAVAANKGRPIEILFEDRADNTVVPTGPYSTQWGNYFGEMIRSIPLYYPSGRSPAGQWRGEAHSGTYMRVYVQKMTSATQEDFRDRHVSTIRSCTPITGSFRGDGEQHHCRNQRDGPEAIKHSGHIPGVGPRLSQREWAGGRLCDSEARRGGVMIRGADFFQKKSGNAAVQAVYKKKLQTFPQRHVAGKIIPAKMKKSRYAKR